MTNANRMGREILLWGPRLGLDWSLRYLEAALMGDWHDAHRARERRIHRARFFRIRTRSSPKRSDTKP